MLVSCQSGVIHQGHFYHPQLGEAVGPMACYRQRHAWLQVERYALLLLAQLMELLQSSGVVRMLR